MERTMSGQKKSLNLIALCVDIRLNVSKNKEEEEKKRANT